MRVAAFVIALVFSLILLSSSVFMSCSYGIVYSSERSRDIEDKLYASGVALISSFLGIIGAAFALKLPMVSSILLSLCSILLIAVSFDTASYVWAIFWFILILPVVFGLAEAIKKRKESRINFINKI
ncbi:MAG: hypothetical protein FXF54_01285 [Kosmotoga sp.]|nr:MAG: hypothetical protein FXF54_01285 [Kosmotoga sp.]